MALFRRKPKTDTQLADTTQAQLNSSLVPQAGPIAGPINDGGGPPTAPSYGGFPTYGGFPGGGSYGGFPPSTGGTPPPTYGGFPTPVAGSPEPDAIERYLANQSADPVVKPGQSSQTGSQSDYQFFEASPSPALAGFTPVPNAGGPSTPLATTLSGDGGPAQGAPPIPFDSQADLDRLKSGGMFAAPPSRPVEPPAGGYTGGQVAAAGGSQPEEVANPSAVDISYGPNAKPITVVSDNGSEIGSHPAGAAELTKTSNPTEASVQKGINAFEQEEGNMASVPNAASAIGPVAITNPKVGSLDPAIETVVNGQSSGRSDASAIGPVAITNPKVGSLDPGIQASITAQNDAAFNTSATPAPVVQTTPDAVDRFVANQPPTVSTTAANTSDAVSRYVGNNVTVAPAPVVQTTPDAVDRFVANQPPTVSTTAANTSDAVSRYVGNGATLLDKPSGPLPTAGAGITAADPSTHIPPRGGVLAM